MAVKTYRVQTTTTANTGDLAESDQTAATRTDGWTVAKIAAANSAHFDAGTKQTSGTFSLQSSTPKPSSFVTGALSNAFGTLTPLTGQFANTAWTFTFAVRATTASAQAGRMRMRVFKSVNADGTSATELTGSTQVGTTSSALSTTADVTSVVTWSPGTTIQLDNEYLFFVLAWEITTASGSNSGDVQIRTGQAAAGSRLVTPDFVVPTPISIGRRAAATTVCGVALPAQIAVGRVGAGTTSVSPAYDPAPTQTGANTAWTNIANASAADGLNATVSLPLGAVSNNLTFDSLKTAGAAGTLGPAYDSTPTQTVTASADWVNLGNTAADDGLCAVVAWVAAGFENITFDNFGFSLPVGAVVTDVKVEFRIGGGDGSGSITLTPNVSPYAPYNPAVAVPLTTYTNSGLWGHNWTKAEIDNLGFTFVLNGLGNYSFDYFRVTVSYVMMEPLTIPAGTTVTDVKVEVLGFAGATDVALALVPTGISPSNGQVLNPMPAGTPTLMTFSGLWGHPTWTQADVGNIGFILQVSNLAATAVSIDYLRVTVTYAVPTTVVRGITISEQTSIPVAIGKVDSPAVAASIDTGQTADRGIVFTARTPGAAGNVYRVTIIDQGTGGGPYVNNGGMSATDLPVWFGGSPVIADDLINEVNALNGGTYGISAARSLGSNGSGRPLAFPWTYLAGGKDAGSVVRGISLAGAGVAPVTIGSKASATAVRGISLAGAGTAPVVIGRIGGAVQAKNIAQANYHGVGNITNRTRIAQSFKLPGSGKVTRVDLWMYKEGSPSDLLQFSIQSDAGGVPSGTNLTATNISASSFSASPIWWQFTALNADLVGGTTYWLVCRRSGAIDAANYISWGLDTAGSYPDGGYFTYNGTSWSALTGYDLTFEVNAVPAIPVVRGVAITLPPSLVTIGRVAPATVVRGISFAPGPVQFAVGRRAAASTVYGVTPPISTLSLPVGVRAATTVVRGIALAPTGIVPISVGKRAAATVVNGVTLAPAPVALAIGRRAAASIVKGISVVPAPVSLPVGTRASATAVRGISLAPGPVSLPVGKRAVATTVRGITLVPAPVAISVGRRAAASTVRGIPLTAVGAAPISVGKVTTATTTRGVTLVPTGAAPISIGARGAATAVRGISLVGAGDVGLAIGKIAVATAVRGISILPSVVVGPYTDSAPTQSGGSTAWVNPGNASQNDLSYATITPLPGGVVSNDLLFDNLGLSIPTGATVKDIVAELVGFQSVNDADWYVRAVKSGVIQGSQIVRIPVPQTNLCSNPEFETNLTGWATLNGNELVARASGVSFSGNCSMQVVAQVANKCGVTHQFGGSGFALPPASITDGSKISVTIKFIGDPGQQIMFGMDTGDDMSRNFNRFFGGVTTCDGTWQTRTATYTVNANDYSGIGNRFIRLNIYLSAPAVNNGFFLDSVIIVSGATPYDPLVRMTGLWGTTWTPAEINDPTSGFRVAGWGNSVSSNISLDALRVYVSYTTLAPIYTAVGRRPSGTSVRGISVAPIGAVPISVGRAASVSLVKGIALAPAGAAPISVGKRTAATSVRGITVIAAGGVPVPVGKRVAATTTRGVSLAGATATVPIGRVSGAPAFPVISGLALRLDASTLGLANGADVYSWPDASGLGNDVSCRVGIDNPPALMTNVVSGLSVVRFVRANSEFLNRSSSIGAIGHIIVVAKYNSASFANYDGLVGDTTALWLVGEIGTNRFYPVGSATYYYNGSDSTATRQAPMGTLAVVGMSFATPTAFTPTVGTDRFNTDRYWDGDIAEVLVYDHALTTGERQQVENYLNTKWITGAADGTSRVKGITVTAVVAKATPLLAATLTVGATMAIVKKLSRAVPAPVTLTPTQALVKKAPRTNAATLTLTPAVQRKISSSLAASLVLSPAQTVKRVLYRPLAVTLNFTGAVLFVKKAPRAVAATLVLTPAQSLRQFRKISFPLTLNLTTLMQSGKLKYQSLAANLILSPTMTKLSGNYKALAATLNLTPTMARFVQGKRVFSVSLPLAPVLVKKSLYSYALSLPLISAFVKTRKNYQTLSAVLSHSAVLGKVRLAPRAFVASVALSAALTKVLKAPRTFNVGLNVVPGLNRVLKAYRRMDTTVTLTLEFLRPLKRLLPVNLPFTSTMRTGKAVTPIAFPATVNLKAEIKVEKRTIGGMLLSGMLAIANLLSSKSESVMLSTNSRATASSAASDTQLTSATLGASNLDSAD